MVADSELQRIARLTPLADVLSSFDIGVGPVEPREVSIAAATGKALAADIAAAGNHPEFALALRDGYAVTSAASVLPSAAATASSRGWTAPTPMSKLASTSASGVSRAIRCSSESATMRGT